MHIPDGYLSPKTCAVFYAAMLPLWWYASRRVERTLSLRRLPLLALGAAFTFVIMMFNIPVPGGSTGHMAGTVVVAVVLGPWAAVLAVSLAVTLQAFLFGDGGVTTLAANSFNMAVLMSFVGYGLFHLASGLGIKRWMSAALAAYAATACSAFAAAIELGIQPALAASTDGAPLYAPFTTAVTVPAMMTTHLLFFAPVEALGTALVVSYVYSSGLAATPGMPGWAVGAEGPGTKREAGAGPLWGALVILVLLTPLGLLATGTAWGEWGTDEIGMIAGFVPAGMENLAHTWKGVLPGYGGGGASGGTFYYILSAALGSAGVTFAVFLWGRVWRR